METLTQALKSELAKGRFKNAKVTYLMPFGPEVHKALVESKKPNPDSGRYVSVLISTSHNKNGEVVIKYTDF